MSEQEKPKDEIAGLIGSANPATDLQKNNVEELMPDGFVPVPVEPRFEPIVDDFNSTITKTETDDEIHLTEDEKKAIEDKARTELKKIVDSIPMKRQNLKFALREMCKESDLLVLYSDQESRAKGIFYLGRLMVVHPEGFAILGPSTEQSPKYAILSEMQLPMMTKMLSDAGFKGFSVEKESSMVFMKSSGELDPATGQVKAKGLIIPSSPFH